VLSELVSRIRGAVVKKGAPDLKEYLSYRPYAARGPLAHLVHERPDVSTYRKMRLDGQVSAALAVIKLPILSRPFAVTSDDADVAEFVRRSLAPVYRNLVRGTLLALDYGFAVLEKVWAADADGLVAYKTFKDPLPESLEIEVDEHGSYAGVRQRPDARVTRDKAFLYTHRLEHGNLYGVSRLRPAYPFWRTKEIIYLFLNRYLERKGNPPVVVRYPARPAPAGGGRVQADDYAGDALALGKKLMENAAVALPHVHDEHGEDQWEISYLEDSPRVRMFLDYIEHLNRMILRAMFVPEKLITHEGEQGSYAAAKVHADIFLMSEEGLIADLEEHFNRFIVKPLVEYNFGPRARAELSVERFTEENRDLLADVFTRMLDSGAVRPAAEAIARELGVPLAGDAGEARPE
jgi:hypothetical protein